MDSELVVRTLKLAIKEIKKVKDPSGIIIHSDHGSQYTGKLWKRTCELNNLIISMGARKTCADNIVIESYHSLLKKGTIHNNSYKSIEEYVLAVINWDAWYNKNKNIHTIPEIFRWRKNFNFSVNNYV